MAKFIYDYWFVQFDFFILVEYVQAVGWLEMEGKFYKLLGGKMVYDEWLKWEILEGWESGIFEIIVMVIGGSILSKVVKKNFMKNYGMFWIMLKDLLINKGKKYIIRGEWDVIEMGIKSVFLKIMLKNIVLFSFCVLIGYLVILRKEVIIN